MASNIIGEAILIIASVIVAGTVAGIVMSKVGVFESTMTSTSEAQKDEMLTKIKIIYATNSTADTVNVWVKNTGLHPLAQAEAVDVYFGPIDGVQRFPFSVGGGDITWEYHPSTPSVWNELETLQINVTDASIQKGPSYLVQVTTPNGISDEYIFSLP